MGRLVLDRPLAFFDLETTGTDPASDRIVEISVVRLGVDGTREARTRRVNPERPIPPDATAVHGITDADVADAPPFRSIARAFLEFLADADLAGFNVLRFDAPLLEREFRDAGIPDAFAGRRIVDALAIYHRKEPRNLAAAVRFYLGREHEGAHAAEADVLATADVLLAQLDRYADLPATVGELAAWCNPAPPGAVDRGGKFVRRDGEIVFNFGKKKGRKLADIARDEPDYLRWMLGSDFPDDVRAIVKEALG